MRSHYVPYTAVEQYATILSRDELNTRRVRVPHTSRSQMRKSTLPIRGNLKPQDRPARDTTGLPLRLMGIPRQSRGNPVLDAAWPRGLASSRLKTMDDIASLGEVHQGDWIVIVFGCVTCRCQERAEKARKLTHWTSRCQPWIGCCSSARILRKHSELHVFTRHGHLSSGEPYNRTLELDQFGGFEHTVPLASA